MRTFSTVLLSALGGLLLLVGGAVAVVVGPDDTASLPAGDVPAASGIALTSYDLFPVRDLTLHVRAAAESGEVFLGVAHPIDARDYVTGVASSWVKGVDRTGALTVDPIAGDLAAPEVAPTDAGFWQDSVSGARSVTLDVALTDEPVALVVAPLGGPAPTTLAFGVVVPQLFAVALGVAAAGLVVVVAAVLVRRGGRRGRTTPPAAGDDPVPTPSDPAPVGAGSPGLQRRVLVVGLGAAVTLTACAPLPSAVEHPDPLTRLALEEADLEPVLTSYGERRSAASTLAATFDPQAWAGSDTGAELAYMEFATALHAARNEPPTAYTTTYTTLDAAVPPHTSFPMSFVALVESTTDGEPEDLPMLRVFERARATSPWLTSFALRVPADSVDLPGFGPDSVASPAQREAGLAALEQVRSHLETGAEIPVDLGELAGFRAEVLEPLEGQRSATVSSVVPFGAPDDPTAPGGPVRVVPVAGGVLVTASLSYVFTQEMSAGWTVSLVDEAVAQVTGQTGERDSLRMVGLVQTALIVPDDGTPPRVIAAATSLVRPRV